MHRRPRSLGLLRRRIVGCCAVLALGATRAEAADAVPAAELVVAIVDAPPGPLTPGQVFGVGFEVRNRGDAPSAPTTVRLTVTRGDDVTTLDEEPLEAVTVSGVRRGRLRAELPATLEPGPLVLQVQVGVAGPLASLPFEVRGPRPNLIVSGLNAVPGEVWPGETLRLIGVVRNAGDAPAPASVLAFSAVRARPALTVPLTTAPVPSLAPGEEVRVRAQAVVPATMTSGRFGILAMADAEETVVEADENDNVAVAPGAIAALPASPGPNDEVDLAVRALTVDGGTELAPAAPLRLRLRVANHGRVEAPSFEVAVLLATREQPEWRREGWIGVISELARTTVPPGLSAGGGESERVLTARLPASLAAGRYFLYAVVDPTASVREPKRPEDLVATPVTVRAMPVVVARGGRLTFASEEVAAGAPLIARATLRNDGNVETGEGSLVLALTGGPGAPTGKRPPPTTGFVTKPLPPIAAGETLDVTFEGVLPPSVPRGVYGWTLRSVAHGAATDVAHGRLTITTPGAGADLVVADAQVVRGRDGHSTPRVRAGDAIVLTARVGNLGDAPAPPTEVAFGEAFGAIVRTLGRRPVPALAPGEFVEVRFATNVGRDARPGDMWWRIGVDPDRKTPPSPRTNDEASIGVEVVARPAGEVAPSLHLVAIDEGPPVTPGGPLDVRGRILGATDGAAWSAVDLDASLIARDGTSVALGRRGVALPGAEGLAFTERFGLPGDLTPGDYIFRLRLDPDQWLPWAAGAAERGVVETPLVVAPPSRPSCDLAVVSVSDERGPRRGPRQWVVSAMVVNRGPGPAPAFSATLYLASGDDERPGVWLPLMARALPEGKLLPGVQTKASFALTLNDDLPAGTYRAVVIVDPEGAVDRSTRHDNTGQVEMRVGGVAAAAVPAAPGGGDVDLTIVDARAATTPATAGATVSVRVRFATKAPGKATTCHFLVFAQRADGSWAEVLTSPPESVPSAGGHAVATLSVPMPADAVGRVRLHIQVRALGEGDAGPDDNGADLEVEVTAPSGTLPRVVSVEAPSKSLVREVATPLTIVVLRDADARPLLLDVVLETGGATYPLGEFDIPAGPAGTKAEVLARVRVPTTLAPGPATLQLRLLREGAPALDGGRWPLPVR